MSARYFVSAPACGSFCPHADEGCAYRVAWAINPHMVVGGADPIRAREEHARFVRALDAAGAKVRTLPFVHGAFDSVFAKDAALVVERPGAGLEALFARPRYLERRAEIAARRRHLHTGGVRAVADAAARFEGGDVVVSAAAGIVFLGHGYRSDAAAAADIERFVGLEVVPLRLRDERLYHLDMVLALLDDGTAVVCREALEPCSFAALAGHPAVRDVVTIPLAEALAFGANMVQIGRRIVTAGAAPTTYAALGARDYEIVPVTLDQFHRAGGSAACLVARVHEVGCATALGSVAA